MSKKAGIADKLKEKYEVDWKLIEKRWTEYEIRKFGEVQVGIWDMHWSHFEVEFRDKFGYHKEIKNNFLGIDNVINTSPFQVILFNYDNWRGQKNEDLKTDLTRGREAFLDKANQTIELYLKNVKDDELRSCMLQYLKDDLIRLEEVRWRYEYIINNMEQAMNSQVNTKEIT